MRREADRVREAAQAYADHLLAGGVATWREFLSDAGGADRGPVQPVQPVQPARRAEPPGAAQAELLRRLNRLAGPGAPPRGDLADRVLRRAAPGRGRVDLRLTDPPAAVPLRELLRVGAGVLADLVAELPGLPEPSDGHVAPGVTRGAPSYRIEGPPLTVGDLRRRLAAAGLPPSGGRRRPLLRFWRAGRPDVVLVVALPLRRALFEVWSRRTQRGATKSWGGALAQWQGTSRLPHGAAYDRIAAAWAGRVGPGRVHVVTGDDLDAQVALVLGHRPAAAQDRSAGRPSPTGAPADLPPPLVEVVRRTSAVLTFRVPPDAKPERLDRLVALLADGSAREVADAGGSTRSGATRGGATRRGAAPGAPPEVLRWLRRTGRRTAARLGAGSYVVHSPLSRLGRVGRSARPPLTRDRAVLAALLESVLWADDARVGAAEEQGTGP